MSSIIKSCFDWFVIFLVYVALRTRWIYFHIHPRYKKFYMTAEEPHFIHEHDGTLHSDVTIELNNGNSIRWWFYPTKRQEGE